MSWEPDVLAALAKLGVGLAVEQRERLDRFASILVERGKRLNLVSAGDIERVRERHLFDSLVAVALLDWSGRRAFDLGSGAGFPGIPLAVALPDARFVLIERTRKRASFLLHAVGALGLTNAEVRWADATELSRLPAFAHGADVVTLRAVANTASALALASRLVREDGCILLWQTENQWTREPTPPEFDAEWHPTPSFDDVKRGIRVCRRRKND